MALTAGSRIGKYQIVEQIGQRGMATVYKAPQSGLERYVALKVVPDYANADAQFREPSQRESVATARVTDGCSMLVSPTSFSDVDLFAELSTPNREASLVVRVRDDGNAYIGVFVPDGAAHLKGRNGSVAIFKAIDGVMTQLTTGRLSGMVQVRDTVRMRLQARGQNHALFLNGREVARATGVTIPEGRVGLRVFGDADGPCDATLTHVRVGLS